MKEKEKQKHNQKPKLNHKEKNDHLKDKKNYLKEKRDCHIEAKKELTKVDLENLKDQVGHEVKPGENIWRIIYEHAKNHGKKTISPNRLQNINITPGDKVYFTDEKVIIKYLDGGTKNISFEESFSCENNLKEKNDKKQEKLEKPKKEDKKDKILSKDVHSKNDTKLNEVKEQKTNGKKEIKEKAKITISQTIFDKDSPLIGDQIAYKNEVIIKEKYSKEVKKIIDKYCKGSIIDENFLYGVIARESRFDKNAKSYTGVKGLGQLTSDTVKTILNINEAKTRNNSSINELYITQQIKGKNGKLDNKKILDPLNQIKLTISYLLYLEDIFNNVTDKNFKTELIITAYNLGPGKTQEILNTYSGIKNWNGLKLALVRSVKNGDIKETKKNEVFNYVPAVKGNIKLASIK